MKQLTINRATFVSLLNLNEPGNMRSVLDEVLPQPSTMEVSAILARLNLRATRSGSTVRFHHSPREGWYYTE